eukprot:gene36831-43956_t
MIEIIPNLAAAFSGAFTQPNKHTHNMNFLTFCFKYLIEAITARRDRNVAYISLGRLFETMSNHLRTTSVDDIFPVIENGFRDVFCVNALKCLAMIVGVSVTIRDCVTVKVVDNMFRGGLTKELIDSLKIIIKYVPRIRSHAQYQLRTHISIILSRFNVVIDEAMARTARLRGASAQVAVVPRETPKYSLFGSITHKSESSNNLTASVA